ncbi:FISUMP domain-containing protein [Chryseobacterium fistulae]|uniref:Fibrobacter succinogenes major paralogous domain-containing protein n=1 Tax=Chryseobacterium fistulae TaxID=2675058 RepID=A0A6N4XSA8_9FLAO|nr:FISUMP domain-containing protein [Chryseobacterium fistulae]CAA7392196.1 hypothetical protein CHRY9393_03060 [Chryseobacterium fistulae]
MKKTNLLPMLLFGALAYGQVGVNTDTPKATLDVRAKNMDGSTAEGILVPRLTGNTLFSAIASNTYGMDQNGAMVYVTETPDPSNQVNQTLHVDAVGYYYFNADQNEWVKMGGGNNFYNADGSLQGPRQVTMDGNNLGFTGGRMGVGTSTPDPSAILDLTSTTDGFLPPRMTKVQMDAIFHPAHGLVIYCTDCFGNKGCIMVNDSTNPLVPEWGSLCSSNTPNGDVLALDCSSATTSGTLFAGSMVSGVNTTIPYSGGNGGAYNAGSFISTGVTGLSATIAGGSLNSGNGTLPFNITGTPSAAGTANFAITIGGKSCTFSVPVNPFLGSITSLNCGSTSFIPPTITQGETYSGTMSIPYTGGNGEAYGQQQFSFNGLTFTLPAGALVNGNGNLVYTVTGTATTAGTMSLPISFAGQSCNVSKTISPSGSGGSTTMCMGNGTKLWASHNLGADTSLDPNPSVVTQGLHGNYYQWGRADVVADAYTPAGNISGWNTTPASNGAWNSGTESVPVKTGIDPCPSGFRVPTRTEWTALLNSSTSNTIGTFSNSPTNFGAARQFTCPSNGNKLTLPASGSRVGTTGALSYRGYIGYYWSSSENDSYASTFYFSSDGMIPAGNLNRTHGVSVRCIAE